MLSPKLNINLACIAAGFGEGRAPLHAAHLSQSTGDGSKEKRQLQTMVTNRSADGAARREAPASAGGAGGRYTTALVNEVKNACRSEWFGIIVVDAVLFNGMRVCMVN